MSTFLSDKPWWAGYLIAAVLILLGLALVTVIYRALRGNRIRTSSARGRQQRLGVVDTHDIGADRQLIIVRRDNIEHLIMIGGPNDVLIEPAIVRGEARALREREQSAPAWASGETPPAIEPLRPLAPEAVAPPEPPTQEPVSAPAASQPARGPRLPDLFARGRRPEAAPESKRPERPADIAPAPSPPAGRSGTPAPAAGR